MSFALTVAALASAGFFACLSRSPASTDAGVGDGSVEWVCEAYPDRVRRLFDSIDLTRAGEDVRRFVADDDWPAACRALLDDSSPERPWQRQGPGWVPAGQGDHDVVRSNSILADTIYVNYIDGYVPRLENGGLDWECRGPRDTAEWAWGLNRQFHLTWLRRAYLKTGDPRYVERIDEELRDWILNSPYPGKKTSSPRWRGLEAAQRVRMWALVLDLSGPGEISPATRILMMSSAADHADYLRRFHAKGNNWVLTEMLGLATIAATWPVFRDAPQWIDYAAAVVDDELAAQIYPDGAHVELSSTYHRIVASEVSTFLEVIEQASGPGGIAVTARETTQRILHGRDAMWSYLARTIRPEGTNPLNNDSDLRDVSAFVERFGWDEARRTSVSSTVFPWAGHVVFRNGWDRQDAQWVFFDIGPWGTAHQHNDKLHLSISAFGRDLLVDAGRYTYKRGPWRKYFTGSVSHNVILVDRAGQNRDRKRVDKPIEQGNYGISDTLSFARGTFDAGYEGVEGTPEHTRVLVYVPGKMWVVADRLITDRPHRIDALWHFHPSCNAREDGMEVVTVDKDKGNLRIVPASGFSWEIDIARGDEHPLQGWYSATVNHKRENDVAVYSAQIGGSSAFAWVLLPARGEVPPLSAHLEDTSLSRVTVVIETGGVRRRITIPFDHGDPVIGTIAAAEAR